MRIFDGKEHAQKLEEKIKDFLKFNKSKGDMVIILVGNNPASVKYTNLKQKFCNKYGIGCRLVNLEETLSDDEVFKKVQEVFSDDGVSGGIIQLPLPRPSLNAVLDLIPVEKDIDVISNKSLEMFYSGNYKKMSPVVRAFDYFMVSNVKNYRDLNAVIVGGGFLVGKPLESYLKTKGSKVKVLEEYKTGTKLNCDLLILSSGVANIVRGEDISDETDVIDFGSTIVEGKTYGDLDRQSELDHLGTVSLSPGGVGPLVVRFLVMNFLGL